MAKAYLDPNIFLQHWQDSLQVSACTEDLLKDFQILSDNLVNTVIKNVDSVDSRTYANYALACAWEKWDKYDPSKNTSIFSFFTEMMKNDMVNHFNYVNRLGNRSFSIDMFFTNKDS